MIREPPHHVYPVLGVAVLAISTAAVVVRAIDDAEPLAIAFWRTALVAVLLSPAVRRVAWRDLGRIALAGACLGGHFAAWFTSLETLDVLRSTVLVCTGPAWVALLEWVFLRHRPAARFWVGLGLALPGIALLTGGPGGGSLAGDLLALAGGQLGAAYLVLGRAVRGRVGVGAYACLVCAAAAAVLFPAVLLAGVPLVGWSEETWLLLLALAAGPQLLGHNGFNYALRWLPAATVSAVTLLEPVGAAVLAAVLLGEIPSHRAILGGLLAIAGVACCFRWAPSPGGPQCPAPSAGPRAEAT